MTAEAWLEARALTKAFGGVLAIGDADVRLRAGEVRGIVGPNGAGKSTLMQMLAGVHPIDSGELLIDGSAVRFRGPDEALAAGIALVPQEMQLAPHLTVAENIVLGREPRRMGITSAGRTRKVAASALRRLGADMDVDVPVDDLTAVGRRLVMVARALVGHARLIILDEPTAALAPQEADAILAAVRTLADGGVTILYVSHRFDDIERVADGVTGIRDARIISELDRSEVTRTRLIELVTPVDSLSHRASGPGAESVGRTRHPERLVLRDIVGPGVNGVSLTVDGGEILGVAGLAGCGADELIRMAAGIDAANGGDIRVDGVAVPSGDRLAAVRGGVAYVPGDRTLASLPNHDIAANISVADLSSVSRGGIVSKRAERSRARVLGDRVHLTAPITASMSSLSGGNQQKAIFARWMAGDAGVLLLHDPTAGVDIAARAEIHQRVRDLAGTGVAVLLVTTDLPELVELCDRVITLDRGQAFTQLEGSDVSESAITASMSRTTTEVSA